MHEPTLTDSDLTNFLGLEALGLTPRKAIVECHMRSGLMPVTLLVVPGSPGRGRLLWARVSGVRGVSRTGGVFLPVSPDRIDTMPAARYSEELLGAGRA